jgi:hypothetical protein
VSQVLREISHASAEQQTGIAQINEAVTHIDGLTQQNAAMDLSAGGAAECFRQFEEGQAPLSYMREVCRYAIAGVENPDTDWPKPVMISERGIKMLSREALDRLPDLVCIEIALLSRAMQLQHDGLKKK